MAKERGNSLPYQILSNPVIFWREITVYLDKENLPVGLAQKFGYISFVWVELTGNEPD
jgi:hypothetical protein